MADSQVAVDYPVYLGVWTNWSLGGRFSGSTITLTHRNGALLTAFLAVFVTFAGSRLWRISCFALHQLLVTEGIPQDGLYHQRQAILRNATDEKSGFASLVRVLWAWRRTASRPIYRMVPLIVFSLLASAAFAIGGIFSSRISSSMGNEVLISSPNCGIPISSNASTTSDQVGAILSPYLAERMTSYSNYAQRCYSNTSRADSCTPFVKKKLPTTIDYNASCPFQAKICHNQNSNIKLDTGYLNSQTHLGLNSPVDLQYNFRVITHCAPLDSKDHQEIVHYSSDKPYMRYFLGASSNDTAHGSNHTRPAHTYEVEQQSADQLWWQQLTSSYAEYATFTKICRVQNGTCDPTLSNFFPIQELAQNDADTELIFLSANGIHYSKPVDDPLYAAHQPTNSTFWSTGHVGTSHMYLSDDPATVLGCKTQYQKCDTTTPSQRGCSPFDGAVSLGVIDPETAGKKDIALGWTLNALSLSDVVRLLQSSSLASRFTLNNGIQTSLPVNQWQLEVENLHNTVLAAFQGNALDDAMGPGSPGMLEYFWGKPSNDVERFLCKNQKIISTSYTNFSLMWLVIVLLLGTLIIVIESLLESVVVWLERRGIIRSSSLEWFSNDTLQLQRMAHEEIGFGDWDGCIGPRVIPITKRGQLLAVLNTRDPTHPMLMDSNERSSSSTNANAALVSKLSSEGRTNTNSSGSTIGGIQPRPSQDGGKTGTSVTYTPTQNAAPGLKVEDKP